MSGHVGLSCHQPNDVQRPWAHILVGLTRADRSLHAVTHRYRRCLTLCSHRQQLNDAQARTLKAQLNDVLSTRTSDLDLSLYKDDRSASIAADRHSPQSPASPSRSQTSTASSSSLGQSPRASDGGSNGGGSEEASLRPRVAASDACDHSSVAESPISPSPGDTHTSAESTSSGTSPGGEVSASGCSPSTIRSWTVGISPFSDFKGFSPFQDSPSHASEDGGNDRYNDGACGNGNGKICGGSDGDSPDGDNGIGTDGSSSNSDESRGGSSTYEGSPGSDCDADASSDQAPLAAGQYGSMRIVLSTEHAAPTSEASASERPTAAAVPPSPLISNPAEDSAAAAWAALAIADGAGSSGEAGTGDSDKGGCTPSTTSDVACSISAAGITAASCAGEEMGASRRQIDSIEEAMQVAALEERLREVQAEAAEAQLRATEEVRSLSPAIVQDIVPSTDLCHRPNILGII